MKRWVIRVMGFCVSALGIVSGNNADAKIDDTVWMQCETTSQRGEPGYTADDFTTYEFGACDDNNWDRVFVAGASFLDKFPQCGGMEGGITIMTGSASTGINGEMVGNGSDLCYCNTTGISCPNSSDWRYTLQSNGCQSGYPDVTENCYYRDQNRGLYLVFESCNSGYAPTPDLISPYYRVYDILYSPTGYCMQCPGLGYSGDAFYVYTPTPGQASSGQFSWGSVSGNTCEAHVQGSITNSKGTFTVTQPCSYVP